jgi:PAS domain S-box-containing protein
VTQDLPGLLQVVNFFFLALALLAMYYALYRLRMELKRSNVLRRRAERFRQLFENTLDGVFQLDAQGRFRSANPALAALLGYADPQDLTLDPRSAADFIADPEEARRLNASLLEKGAARNHFLRIRRRDGGFLFAQVTVTLRRDASGAVLRYEGIVHDVTDRVALEQELSRRSESLERSVEEKAGEILRLERRRFAMEKLAAVGETTAAFVHEIRNPLSTVKMAVATLEGRADLAPAERRSLELAGIELGRLERMLRDVLDFTRPGDFMQCAPQDLHTVLDQALERSAAALREHGAVLEKRYAEGSLPVMVDAERMMQVVTNLVQNAAEASPRGKGRVTLVTERLPGQEAARIEVRDNGPGFSEEDLPRAFDLFFTRRPGGTGLGLPVVRKIVEAHRGRVAIGRAPGGGAAVSVELPLGATS